jgi:transposase
MTKREGRFQNTYTDEQKEAVIKRMLPPSNTPMSELSRETGINKSTLNTWKQKALEKNNNSNRSYKPGKELSSKEKFLIVMETYSMPEIQLSEYCRTRGLYVEQVKKWREGCMNANDQEQLNSKELKNELHEEKKRTKTLEKELNRKEKALAETAALLVLRKKLGAILGDQEEE